MNMEPEARFTLEVKKKNQLEGETSVQYKTIKLFRINKILTNKQNQHNMVNFTIHVSPFVLSGIRANFFKYDLLKCPYLTHRNKFKFIYIRCFPSSLTC